MSFASKKAGIFSASSENDSDSSSSISNDPKHPTCKNTWYGWYSPTTAKKFGHMIYENAEGEQVSCTMVTSNSEISNTLRTELDLVSVGVVTNFICSTPVPNTNIPGIDQKIR